MALVLHPEFQLYEKKHMPFCSSLQVAESFGKQHKNVLRDISAILANKFDDVAVFNQLNFERVTYTDEKGEKRPMFLMTKNGFTLLVMGYTGEKAMRFKIEYIQRFDSMALFIRSLNATKEDFPIFAQAVFDAHNEPQSYHYSTECDMINRIVLGCSAKKFKELHALNDITIIRPFLSDTQLKAVKLLQKEDVRLLYQGVDFQERKSRLTTLFSQHFNIPILAHSIS